MGSMNLQSLSCGASLFGKTWSQMDEPSCIKCIKRKIKKIIFIKYPDEERDP